jgi:glycosyltransferase involved in cell wall biosynthesis
MTKLYLYSPINPAKTGTANYFRLFISQIPEEIIENNEIVIVIDHRFYSHNIFDNSIHKIVDFRDIKKNTNDISVYFLANNEFHRYAHKELFNHKPENGLAVSVVHEPCMWMNVQAMCSMREYGFNEEHLPYFAKYQYGEDAEFFCRQNLLRKTNDIFDFTSLAATHIYENSNVIVFHSVYAKNKFILEKSPSYKVEKNPQIIVMEHPYDDASKNLPESITKDKYVVGTFGWVKKVKQVEDLLLAYNDFYITLNDEQKDTVELRIVGETEVTRDFNPVGLAANLECTETVKFYGYVTNQKMDELLAGTSIIFSLRFPSCGESSGPVYKTKSLGIPIALSNYGAFAEEDADYFISVNMNTQRKEIQKVIAKEYAIYVKKDKREVKKRTKNSSSYKTVGSTLKKIIAIQNGTIQ